MPPTLASGWSVRDRLTEDGSESDLDSEAEIAELMHLDLVDEVAASGKQTYPRPSNAM